MKQWKDVILCHRKGLMETKHLAYFFFDVYETDILYNSVTALYLNKLLSEAFSLNKLLSEDQRNPWIISIRNQWIIIQRFHF